MLVDVVQVSCPHTTLWLGILVQRTIDSLRMEVVLLHLSTPFVFHPPCHAWFLSPLACPACFAGKGLGTVDDFTHMILPSAHFWNGSAVGPYGNQTAIPTPAHERLGVLFARTFGRWAPNLTSTDPKPTVPLLKSEQILRCVAVSTSVWLRRTGFASLRVAAHYVCHGHFLWHLCAATGILSLISQGKLSFQTVSSSSLVILARPSGVRTVLWCETGQPSTTGR